MPEFVPILIVAVLVLLALMMAFGGIELTEEEKTTTTVYDLDYEEIEDYNTLLLGGNFTIRHISESQKAASVSGNITKGMTVGSYEASSFRLSDIDDIDAGLVKIHVNDTNYYGRLLVYINGKKVWAEYAGPGEYEALVSPEIFKRVNTMTVRAGGSGWRIWAPTVYTAEVDLYIEYFGVSTKKFEFELNNIPDKARVVVFGTGKGSGELEVKINDFKVYKGYLTAYKYFDPDVMKPGTNKVTINAGENGEYDVESAKLIFWYD